MAKGSFRQRDKDRWQLEVDLGYTYTADGTRKRNKKYKTITAKGSREAEKELIKFVAEVTGESYFEPEKMMFRDFVLNQWLPNYGVKHLAKSTLATYKSHLFARILPAFQSLRLDQVSPLHITSFLNNLEEEGMRLDNKAGKLSGDSLEWNHRILRNIFKRAVEWKLLKESPAANVKKPKRNKTEIKVFDDNGVQQTLLALSKELLFWQVLIKLSITCAVRRSELLGIEEKDIDLDGHTISIRQSVTYTTEDGYVIGDTKSVSSERKVSFPESLTKDLKKLITQKKRERLAATELFREGKYNFIFSDINGKPYHPDSVSTWWTRFIKRHNLPKVTLHGLRHTSATILINKGVHPKLISERLGHSDIRVTMNTYGHVLRQADKSAAQKFDDLLGEQA